MAETTPQAVAESETRLTNTDAKELATSAIAASVAIHIGSVLLLGVPGTIAATLPIALYGFLYGTRWGALAGVVSYPVNMFALWAAQGSPLPFLTSMGSALGTLAGIGIGWLIGYTRVLRDAAVKQRNTAVSQLTDAFEYAPVGMAILDTAGRFERVNPAFAAMVTRSEDQLVGMNWRDISPQREHAETQARIAALFEGTEDMVHIERAFLTSDGTERLGTVHMSLVAETGGQPTRMLAQMADITELQQANVKLHELLASKDRFLAAISHELRTPLSAVSGLALELRDRVGDFSLPEITEFAGVIAQQSIEVGHLVEDFLVHSRADTNQINVRHEPVDLVAEAERVLRLMQGSPLADISLGANGEQVMATGDDIRVRQIIRNLLQNAFRHGGPEISISARESDGWSTLAVIDDGDGIEEERLETVFEPFERSHSDPGLTESLGIGLYISRTLARLMGGDIAYHREAGKTHFLLKLPRPIEITSIPHTLGTSARQQPLSSSV